MRSLTALQLSACLRVCPSARVAASELLSWGGGFGMGDARHICTASKIKPSPCEEGPSTCYMTL